MALNNVPRNAHGSQGGKLSLQYSVPSPAAQVGASSHQSLPPEPNHMVKGSFGPSDGHVDVFQILSKLEVPSPSPADPKDKESLPISTKAASNMQPPSTNMAVETLDSSKAVKSLPLSKYNLNAPGVYLTSLPCLPYLQFFLNFYLSYCCFSQVLLPNSQLW